jgi:hypothetical protein
MSVVSSKLISTNKGMKMKFVIRRLAVGLISIPLIAGAYVFLYLCLLLAGAEATIGVSGAFDNGLLIGLTSAVFFTFYPQISKVLDKVLA